VTKEVGIIYSMAIIVLIAAAQQSTLLMCMLGFGGNHNVQKERTELTRFDPNSVPSMGRRVYRLELKPCKRNEQSRRIRTRTGFGSHKWTVPLNEINGFWAV
jgi:hypothetical protein